MKKRISLILSIVIMLSASASFSAQVGTSTQHPGVVDDSIYIPVDTFMIYNTDPVVYKAAVDSLPGGAQPSMMVAINRATRSEIDANATLNDTMIQTKVDGSFISHADTGSNFYMVPTTEMSEYIADKLVECVRVQAPYMIALEEPEIWLNGGYSDSFKAEWEKYYGTPWEDPNGNAEAQYFACRLRVELFKKAIQLISDAVKAQSPETKILIATHSTLNYSDYAIASGVAFYAAMDCVDGIIGQTWSDTINQPFTYRQNTVIDAFNYGFLEYSSYISAVYDKEFYALADPAADNPNYTWEENAQTYKKSITAQFCVPQISQFEIAPWPSRAFAVAPLEYKTIQLNLFKASQQIAGAEGDLTAGTKGISIGLSDTYSWVGDNFLPDKKSKLMSVAYELIQKGIPVGFNYIDNLSSTEDLDGVELLILSYELIKPESKKSNEVIAEWVKQGGKVLYIGGEDELSKSDKMQYSSDGSPFRQLMNCLDIENITVDRPLLSENIKIDFLPADIQFTFSRLYSEKFYAISGSGFEPLAQGNGLTVGAKLSVGNGSVVLFTLPLEIISGRLGYIFVPSLVETALEQPLSEADAFICRRGDITTVHAFEKTTLSGSYIDLFNSEQPLVENPVVDSGEDAVLLALPKAEKIPSVVFSNGQRTDSELFTEEKSEITVYGPTTSLISTVFSCKGGIYPQKITTTGNDARTLWDDLTSTLTVAVQGSSSGTKISVEWGTEKTNLTDLQQFVALTVPTNDKNADAEYLYFSNAGVNPGVRFADLDLEIIYKFDLNTFSNASFSFFISQHYIFEISPDPENFSTVADYSEIDPNHSGGGSPTVCIIVNPKDYNLDDTMYVRIRNTDTTKGHGGAISSFSIFFSEPSSFVRRGDVNDDTLVSLVDAMIVFYHVSGKTELTDANALARADVDEDGEVTLADAMKIFKAVAKKGRL